MSIKLKYIRIQLDTMLTKFFWRTVGSVCNIYNMNLLFRRYDLLYLSGK